MNPIEVGIISDTHGVLRPQALEALQGVSMILHAGDVCGQEIIQELSKIAPVTGVRGNCDTDGFGSHLPLSEAVAVGGVWIYMYHGHTRLDISPGEAGFKVVISGHTHVPRLSQGNGVLWINPGSAGPRRFNLPVTIARLTICNGEVEARLIDILTHSETTLSSQF
ncbi:MAG: metallophosphatase family protein [Puniceicoccales bacterium]|jgi:putative phosphoesterase|nr:metallophosphatase family protein [Puniceicoccales bacterium]